MGVTDTIGFRARDSGVGGESRDRAGWISDHRRQRSARGRRRGDSRRARATADEGPDRHARADEGGAGARHRVANRARDRPGGGGRNRGRDGAAHGQSAQCHDPRAARFRAAAPGPLGVRPPRAARARGARRDGAPGPAARDDARLRPARIDGAAHDRGAAAERWPRRARLRGIARQGVVVVRQLRRHRRRDGRGNRRCPDGQHGPHGRSLPAL